MNTQERLFTYAESWKKRKEAGEKQVEIAQKDGFSEAYVSRVLKFEKLPKGERDRYHSMTEQGKITEAALLDLADAGGEERRHSVLDKAIELCTDRDAATEDGKKGRPAVKGQVTVHEIRSALLQANESV